MILHIAYDGDHLDVADVVETYKPQAAFTIRWTRQGEERYIPYARVANAVRLLDTHRALLAAGRRVDVPSVLLHWLDTLPLLAAETKVRLQPIPTCGQSCGCDGGVK